MIWDAIDMIMPLRGLLALSCLDPQEVTYMLSNALASRVRKGPQRDGQYNQFYRVSKGHIH